MAPWRQKFSPKLFNTRHFITQMPLHAGGFYMQQLLFKTLYFLILLP